MSAYFVVELQRWIIYNQQRRMLLTARKRHNPSWGCGHFVTSVPRVAAKRVNPGLFSVTASR